MISATFLTADGAYFEALVPDDRPERVQRPFITDLAPRPVTGPIGRFYRLRLWGGKKIYCEEAPSPNPV